MNDHEYILGQWKGFDAVTLRSPKLDATVVPPAGMVCISLRHDGVELLARPTTLRDYQAGGGLTGMALVFPSINRLDRRSFDIRGRHIELQPDMPGLRWDANELPIHGVQLTSDDWNIVTDDTTGYHVLLSASLKFQTHADLTSAFPFKGRVWVVAILSRNILSLQTTVFAADDVGVPIAFGYHPFFQLPDTPRSQWIIDCPVRRRVVLDDRMLPTTRREDVRLENVVLGDRTFDDLYEGISPRSRFTLSDRDRRIAVTFRNGYPYAQIYAPPGSEFVCIEPMTAPIDALCHPATLDFATPDRPVSATFEIEVEHVRR